MCGITGILSADEIEKDWLSRMTRRLNHRGPDASATFLSPDNRVGLGHTRLSIIDLDARANQPFSSASGRYVIVFNGEIYNYRDVAAQLVLESGISLRTTSDTEVIVEGFAYWGEAVINKLEGMFALAIADLQSNRLLLARDRLGKKPLFTAQIGNLFLFGSEIKAILQHPSLATARKLDTRALHLFLHLGYVPEPFTLFSAIRKFPAGCVGEVSVDRALTTRKFWSPKLPASPQKPQDKVALEEFGDLLKKAVTDRLVSDVPVGAFLSGGVDSSLVTAFAAREVGPSFKTFSIGFDDHVFDESGFARRVAGILHTDHHELIVRERDAVDALDEYVRHFDEPFADTSAIPTMLVSRFARKHVKVVLTGDGGDELFQGYGAYTWANRLNSLPWRFIKAPMKVLMRYSGRDRLERVSHLFEAVESNQLRSHIFSQEQYLFSQREIRESLLKDTSSYTPFIYDDPHVSSHWSAGEKQALFDIQYYLKDDLLVKIDRASMHEGLECRSPLLDHRLVTYALSLDKSLKIRNGTTKWLLKQLLSNYLPQDLVNRKKRGFSVPLASWLKGDLRYLIDQFANDTLTEEMGIFEPRTVSALRARFFGGKDYLFNRLWIILLVQKWLKENV